MRVHILQKGTPETAEVRMFWVVHLSDTPGVNSGTNGLSINLNFLL